MSGSCSGNFIGRRELRITGNGLGKKLRKTLAAFLHRRGLAADFHVLGYLGLGLELGGAVDAEEVHPLDVALQVVRAGRTLTAKVARIGEMFCGFVSRLVFQVQDFRLRQPGRAKLGISGRVIGLEVAAHRLEVGQDPLANEATPFPGLAQWQWRWWGLLENFLPFGLMDKALAAPEQLLAWRLTFAGLEKTLVQV